MNNNRKQQDGLQHKTKYDKRLVMRRLLYLTTEHFWSVP